MSDFAWFKLLIRAIGVLLIGLSIPMVLYTIGFGIANQLSNSMPLSALMIPWLPMLAGYGVQAGFGLYLLVGAEGLINRCIAGVRHNCAACGYNLEGITSAVCPECGAATTRRAATGAGHGAGGSASAGPHPE